MAGSKWVIGLIAAAGALAGASAAGDDPQSAKLVIGRLPLEKLAALAEVKAVRFVAPQTR